MSDLRTRLLSDSDLRERLVAAVAPPLGGGDCLIAAGSLVQGYGNATSDLDLMVLRDAEATNDALYVSDSKFSVNIQYLDDIRLDVTEVTMGTLSEWAESINRASESSYERPSGDLETVLNNLRTGVVIYNQVVWNRVSASFPWEGWRRLIVKRCVDGYNGYAEDAAGAIDANDLGSAYFSSRKALEAAIDALIASSGSLNTKHKWRLNKLTELGLDDVRTEFERFAFPAGREAALEEAVARILLAQQLIGTVYETKDGNHA